MTHESKDGSPMVSRADQMHSYQFNLRRVVAALAVHDPDRGPALLARTGPALLAGVIVATLGLAAMAVYGVIRPGSDTTWRDGRSIIIEAETGARFVLRDGVLHPVLNHASALLILGTAEPHQARVVRADLSTVPRGVPLGISGAPDPLPAAAQLVTSPWRVCSRPAAAGSPGAEPESILLIGVDPPAPPVNLGEQGLLVSDPSGATHLIWHGHRFWVRRPQVVLPAFGWSGHAPLPVPTAVLEPIPAGPDLEPPPVPGRGRPSSIAGVRTGTVIVVENQGGARQFGAVLSAGIADITQVQADLLLASGSGLRRMSAAQYSAAPHTASLVPNGSAAPPASTPQLAAPDTARGVCASFMSDEAVPTVALAVAQPRVIGEVATGVRRGETGADSTVADWIAVPPGRGAVVQAPFGTDGSLAVISELGLRFPVPSRQVLDTLGYPGVVPVRLPPAVVALVPSGRALDPEGLTADVA